MTEAEYEGAVAIARWWIRSPAVLPADDEQLRRELVTISRALLVADSRAPLERGAGGGGPSNLCAIDSDALDRPTRAAATGAPIFPAAP